jgi:hypothetical protein
MTHAQIQIDGIRAKLARGHVLMPKHAESLLVVSDQASLCATIARHQQTKTAKVEAA